MDTIRGRGQPGKKGRSRRIFGNAGAWRKRILKAESAEEEKNAVVERPLPPVPSPEPPNGGKKPAKKPKGKKKSKRWIIVLAVIAAVVFFGLRYLNSRATQFMSSVYTDVEVGRADMLLELNGTGTVTPNDSYTVAPRAVGDVLSAPFEEGDIVERGALLYQIDPSDVENSIASAEDGVRNANENVIKAQDGIGSAQRNVQNAELSLQSSQRNYDDLVKDKADYDEDRAELLEDMRIKSDWAGQIIKLNYEVGDRITSGAAVADIRDSAVMLLTTRFHSVDANEIYVGAPAVVTMTATGEQLTATVDSVSAIEIVGEGGSLVREVKLRVFNPGGLTENSLATAEVAGIACQSGGTFSYLTHKTVYSTVSGKVEEIYCFEGGFVSVGQAILRLEDPDENTTLDRQVFNAGVQLAQAGISLANAQNSAKAAQDSLRIAQDSVRTAERNLKNARDLLDDYRIDAPIRGTVIEKNYKVGDNYDPTASNAKAMAVIFDLSSLSFVMNVDELDVRKLTIGQKVDITADAVEDKEFVGYIDKININGTTVNGVTTYPVTIRISGANELLPGMNISADITLERALDVLVIPALALQRGNTVLVKSEGAVGDMQQGIPQGYESRDVVIGRTDGTNIEILEGLREGELVGYIPPASGFMSMIAGSRVGGGAVRVVG